MILELIGTVLSGVFSGGATGLLGVALQQWSDARKRRDDIETLKLQQQQAIDLRKLDMEQQLKLAGLSAESAERLADIDAQARATAAASADYQASMGNDKATYLSPDAQKGSKWATFMMALVDFLRGIIRPGATIYSLGLLTILTLWVRDLYSRSLLTLSADQSHALAMLIIGTVTYLSVTCTVWWFGVRGQSPRLR